VGGGVQFLGTDHETVDLQASEGLLSGHLHETMARLVALGTLGHTLPDKPTSRLQRYRLTPIGRAILASRR